MGKPCHEKGQFDDESQPKESVKQEMEKEDLSKTEGRFATEGLHLLSVGLRIDGISGREGVGRGRHGSVL